jgi:hypothetical protein
LNKVFLVDVVELGIKSQLNRVNLIFVKILFGNVILRSNIRPVEIANAVQEVVVRDKTYILVFHPVADNF